MRSDLRSQREKTKKEKFWRFTKRWALLFLILTIIFCAGMAVSGLFSWKILAIGCGVLLLMLLLIMPPMRIRRFKQSRRTIAFAVSIVMIAVYALGGFYIAGALDFIGTVTGTAVEAESYYVVVRDDDEFNDIKDIAGEQVIGFRSGKGFSEAEAKLMKSVDCTVVDADDLSAMVDCLLSGEYNVLLMNSANYITISDRRKEEFEDYTKILEVIRINTTKENFAKNVKVTREPFNVMITGLDVDGSIDVESRSDVNIVATVNPKTKQVLLTSIPRDYYVKLPGMGEGSYDKLTHTGLYGADETVAAVEELLGIDINYYVKVNYSTLVRVVDAIGGIDVYSDYEFTTNGQDWYYFEAGDIHLDGHEALAFARERQAFEDGDFQRNKNQQKVLAAIIKKMTSSAALLTKYTDILAAVKENLEMNMSGDEIKALVRMQMDDMSSWDIQSQSIIGDLDFLPCYSLGGDYASVVRRDKTSVEEAKVLIYAVMGKSYEIDTIDDNYYPDFFPEPSGGGDYYEDYSQEGSSDSGEGSGEEYYGDSGEGSGEEYYGDSGEGSGEEYYGDSGEGSGDEYYDDSGEGSGEEYYGDSGEGSGGESYDDSGEGSGEESYDDSGEGSGEGSGDEYSNAG